MSGPPSAQQIVNNAVLENLNSLNIGLDTCWILVCSALVILMQVGFAYVEAGNVRAKNVKSILLKNAIDFILGGLLFFTIGNAFARGKTWYGVIGTTSWASIQDPDDTSPGSLYQAGTLFTCLFACTTSTIISGAIAERMRLSAYVCVAVVAPLCMFCLPAHWVWHSDGFLNSSDNGYLAFSDFAGGAVVHGSGGAASIVAAWFLGPRIGRFGQRTGYDRVIDGHSPVLAGLGTWLIIFGWFGFNAGSSLGLSHPVSSYAASLAALNTFLAMVMSGLVTTLYYYYVVGKFNLGEILNSMLAGAAAITAGCAYVNPASALFIGFVGGLGYLVSVPIVARKLKIDDPLNAISVHFTGGVIGTLMLGLFHATEGLFTTGAHTKFVAQIIGTMIILGNTVVWTFLVLLAYTLVVGPVRLTEKDEIAGGDKQFEGRKAGPLGFINSILCCLCCSRGSQKEYGRPRPFDPFHKFAHTETISDGESDNEEDIEMSMGGRKNGV